MVEIRLEDNTVRTGRVDGVTSDDQILRTAAGGSGSTACDRGHGQVVPDETAISRPTGLNSD
jgi:hypothetical protein